MKCLPTSSLRALLEADRSQDLARKCEDEATKQDLLSGVEATERVLTNANEAVNRGLLDEAREDLKIRVDDWKNHRIEQFGNLLQHGVYAVVTGKTDQEKDVRVVRLVVLARAEC
jgi:cell division control protein 24